MIANERMVENVKRIFDLNLYEARLWLALLSRGISTAGELSEISAVPRSRTYDVLESLREKSLITIKRETRPVKYIAIPPHDALVQAKKNFENKMDEQSKFIDGLRPTEIIQKLKGLHNSGKQLVESHEKAGLLRSRRSIGHHIGTLFRTAKNTIDILATGEELEYLVRHHLDDFEKTAAKGVKIRIAGNFADKHKSAIKAVGELAAIKSVPKISARIIMKDKEEMIFSLFSHADVHELYDNAVWIHSNYFVKAVSDMFEHLWNAKK